MSYDCKTYQTEIKKVLGHSSVRWLGPALLEDLAQEIHLELSSSAERYGDKMNAALAYRVARNQANTFMKRRKEPSALSFDEKAETEDENLEMSYAEILLAQKESEGVRAWDNFSEDNPAKMENQETWSRAFNQKGGISLLRELARKWYGTKRLIADVMLDHPEITVRDFPDIPPSTVSRVRQVILKEFKDLIRTAFPATNGALAKMLARNFLDFIRARNLTMTGLMSLPSEEQGAIRSLFLSESKEVIK